MENIFTDIYEKKVWGDNKNSNYNGSSGGGSDIEYNKNTYIPFLREYIVKNGIKSVVDLGCGDFKCGNLIYNDLNVEYTGYDTYKKVVESNSNNKYNFPCIFKHLDFYNNKEEIVEADMCIIKDVLQHWSNKSIYTFLDYLTSSKKYKFILICNCSNQNQDYNEVYNEETHDGGSRPLNTSFLPLKKYNITREYVYNTKEVSIIKTI